MDDQSTDRVAMLSGAFFLFGLAALFMLDWAWPGALLLLGIAALPIMLKEEGLLMTLWMAAQMVIWLGGIPVLMALGLLWPGVLILAGLSAVVVAVAPPDDLKKRQAGTFRGRKRKSKRALPLPPDEDAIPDEDEADAWYTEETDRAAYHAGQQEE